MTPLTRIMSLALLALAFVACSRSQSSSGNPPENVSWPAPSRARAAASPPGRRPARPVAMHRASAKRTSARPPAALLARLGLAHLQPVGVKTCDQILAAQLCFFRFTPAQVHAENAKDLARTWRGWRRRLRSGTPAARAALERDCRSTLPILQKLWGQLPGSDTCAPR